MHLVFVDIIYGYNAARPESDLPLGGTTSAVCYVAREMVARGIQCTILNATTKTETQHGVTTKPLSELGAVATDPGVSAFIFCGRWLADAVPVVKKLTRAPLIAWMHESTFDDQLVQPLADFDGMAFVSEWQKRANTPQSKPNWKTTVIRNAMHPAFADALFAPGEDMMATKAKPPKIVFAGDFVRGAIHIATILDDVRPHVQDFSVDIFSTAPRGANDVEEYTRWLLAQPNIAHFGKVGQMELAQRMKQGALFLFPNPYPETSCINLMQAMASGMRCVISERAALPETAHGFAHLIPIEDADNNKRADLPINHKAFAQALVRELQAWTHNPNDTAARMQAQRRYFLEHYQWKQRVDPWLAFLQQF